MSKFVPYFWVSHGKPIQRTVDVEAVDDAAKYHLGAEVMDRDGTLYRYGMAQAEVTAGNFVKEHTTPNQYNHTGALGVIAGVAHVTIALNKFGWIKVRGVQIDANMTDGAIAGKGVFASGTAGRAEWVDVTNPVTQAEGRKMLAQGGGVSVVALTNAAANKATVRLA